VPQPPLFLPDGAQRAKVAAEQAGENTADRHQKQRKKPCKLAKMSHLFRKLQISFSKLPFSSSRLSCISGAFPSHRRASCFLRLKQNNYFCTRKSKMLPQFMSSTPTTLSPARKGLAGVQYLFVAFGATVLVPLLVGLDPSTALFSAGVGTLIFHLITKGKVPIFLGSSFAFIAPIVKATELYGLGGALFGCVGVAAVYALMSLLIRLFGLRFIDRLFPPVVIGPIIMLIGLSLSSSAVNMASTNWLLAAISLATAVVVTLYGRGMLKLIPIFLGIVVGYVADLLFFEVDFSQVAAAPWFGLPHFILPEKISWEPILFMIPVAIAPVIEHIGDVYVVNNVTGENFVKSPGLHRTMLGDGAACLFASLVGAPPVTTYSEVTGAMSLTRITDPLVFRIAALTGIVFSLVGKVSALLRSIDQAILGGIMLLLFGTIAGAGISSLLHSRINLSSSRNVVIISVTLTTGIGGAVLSFGKFSLAGIGLSALVAVVLNLLLPERPEDRTPTVAPHAEEEHPASEA